MEDNRNEIDEGEDKWKKKWEENETKIHQLRGNLIKLKKKLMDTSTLVSLFTKSKENLSVCQQQLKQGEEEKQRLKDQLESTLMEISPLRNQIHSIQNQYGLLEKDSEKIKSQLKSAQAFNVQLKAELDKWMQKDLEKRDETNDINLKKMEKQLKKHEETIEKLKKTKLELEDQLNSMKTTIREQEKKMELEKETMEVETEDLSNDFGLKGEQPTDLIHLTRLIENVSPKSFKSTISQCSNRDVSNEIIIIAIGKAVLKSFDRSDIFVDLIESLCKNRGSDFEEKCFIHLSELIIDREDIYDLSSIQTSQLCCIITSISKKQKNLKRPRILCYDLMRERHMVNVELLCSIQSHWGEVLKSGSLLSQTIQAIVCSHDNSDKKKQHQVKSLKKLCDWDDKNLLSCSELVELLINEMRGPNMSGSYNAIKSLELLSVHLGWIWTYNQLILGRLWSMLDPNTEDQRSVCFAIRLCGLLGRTAYLEAKNKEIEPFVVEGLEQLRKRIEMIIRYGGDYGFSLKAQSNAISSLIDIGSKDQYHLVGKWFSSLGTSHKSLLPDHLLNSLLIMQQSQK